MKYIVEGGLIMNDMLYADGSTASGYIGGAVYSVNGVRPWDDEVLYMTKVGDEWEQYIGQYMKDNNLPTDGIFPVLKHTMYSRVCYKPSGEWHEYSLYDDYDFMDWSRDSKFSLDEILQFCGPETKGMYLEGGSRPTKEFIDAFHKKSPDGKLMIELSTMWCNEPEYHEMAMEQIKISDIYSLNLPESKNLFGTNSEEESIQKIIELGVPCFFRIGVGGAYMIQDGKAWYAPLMDFGKSVDATGCGNCSTAAAMYGYAEGLHPLMTCIKANLASGINAAQFGPYLKFTPELREEITGYAENAFAEILPDDGAKVHTKPYVFRSLY